MLKAGIHKIKITPDIAIEGSYRLHYTKMAKGIHDDLYAVAVFLDDSRHTLLLISLDLIALTTEFTDEIKQMIENQTGVRKSAILISCTHTHNGPDLLDEEKRCDPGIKKELKQQIIICSQRSIANSGPAKIGFGECCIPIAVNRQFQECGEIPGISLGTIDPVCDIIKIEDLNGEIKGIFFHYSSHPICAMASEFKISRDCVGVTVDVLEKHFHCTSAFFQGASGDVKFQLNGNKNFKISEFTGLALANKILPVIEMIKTNSQVSINSQVEVISIPNRNDINFVYDSICTKASILAKEFNDDIANNIDEIEIFKKYNLWRVLNWQKIYYEQTRSDYNKTAVSVQSLTVGDTIIVGLPGEMFVGYQIGLRKYFFPRRAMLFGNANGYIGYVPTKDSIISGGYGTEANYVCRASADSGERILKMAIELTKKVVQASLPDNNSRSHLNENN